MGLTADRCVTQCKSDPGAVCGSTAGVPAGERAWCLRMWRSISGAGVRARLDAYGYGKSEQGICGSLVQLVSNLSCEITTIQKMSGDNEETQTAEETSVEEKVSVQRISSSAAPLTLLQLTLATLRLASSPRARYCWHITQSQLQSPGYNSSSYWSNFVTIMRNWLAGLPFRLLIERTFRMVGVNVRGLAS